jgi:hypothetical protein
MPGIALLFIILIVLILGAVFFGRLTRSLNQRRRRRPGDKDLGEETGGEPPLHRRVTNEEQPRFQ